MIPEVEEYNRRNIDAIRSHFKHKIFKYPYGNRFLEGGKLICLHCGKEYTWKDWGRDKSRALTLAVKHLDKHDKFYAFSPYLFRDYNMFYTAFPNVK